MSYLGSWKIDDLLTFPAITHRFDTGALTDADSVPSYRVYEDETGTAILTGSMAKLDDGNTTGFYTEQLTLSAANGFEKGKCYTVYMTAPVNSVTGGQHHTFQIEAEVDANRLNWLNVDNPTTTIGLSGTTIKTATDVEADTQDLQSRTPAALVSGRMDSHIGSIADAVLTAAKFAAGAFDAVWSVASRTLTAFGFSVTVGTNTDKTGYTLTAGEHTALVDETWDEAVDGAVTARQSLRLANSANGGKASGMGTTTAVLRDLADTKDRVSATVDANGNRTAVTRDLT